MLPRPSGAASRCRAIPISASCTLFCRQRRGGPKRACMVSVSDTLTTAPPSQTSATISITSAICGSIKTRVRATPQPLIATTATLRSERESSRKSTAPIPRRAPLAPSAAASVHPGLRTRGVLYPRSPRSRAIFFLISGGLVPKGAPSACRATCFISLRPRLQ